MVVRGSAVADDELYRLGTWLSLGWMLRSSSVRAVSLHGCVLNPLLPSLFRVSCPILTGYLRISFLKSVEVTVAKEMPLMLKISMQKCLQNRVEAIAITGWP